MIRFLLLFILFITTHIYAFEEVCLSGETTTYKFGSNASLEVSLPSIEFNSSLSACNYALSVYDSVKDSNNVSYYLETRFLGVQDMGTGVNACHISFRKNVPFSEFEHDYISIEKVITEKDCSCPDGETRNFNGICAQRCPNGSTWDGTRCVLTSCPEGQHLDGSRCLDDELEPEQCEDGYYRGDDNFCHKYEEEQCPTGEKFVDGVCVDDRDEDDQLDICDPKSNFYFLCQWYHDWQEWWTDYTENEEQSASDQQDILMTIDDLRQNDAEFYDQVREWLENNNGSPSSQYPIIQFPPFCEWSNNICNWYLDWKDWRTDYSNFEEQAYNDRQKIIENQEKDLKQNADFYDDARDFMEKQDNEQNQNPLQPDNTPYEIKDSENVNLGINHYIQSSSGCPNDRLFPLSMGGYTTNIVISYQSLCSAAIMFKPFVILMSFIAGIFIITNTGRRAETGD